MRLCSKLLFLFSLFPVLLTAQSNVGNPAVLDSLEKLLPTITDDSSRLQLFYDLMSDYNNVNPRQTLRYADSVIKWADILDNPKRKYQGQYSKGSAYFFLGENDSAEKYVRQVENSVLALGVAVDIADYYNLLASVQKSQGDYLGSLESYQEGLAVSNEVNDTNSIYTILVNMAEIYSLQEDFEPCIQTYEDALALILAAEGESFAAAVVYNNLAELEPISTDSALAYLKKAQAIFSGYGYPDGEAHTHANMGKRFMEREDYPEAIRQFQAAVAIWEKEETNFKPGLVMSYAGLAEAYALTNNMALGRSFLEKSIDLGEAFDLKPELKDAYLQGMKVEEIGQNPAQALYYLKKGTALNEALLNEARTKALSSSRIRFQTEEKEKELIARDLKIAQQQNQQFRLWGGLLLTLALALLGMAFILVLMQRQRNHKKEASLALQIKETENDALQQLNQLKSRFFANISHEFRTPLTLILGPLNQLLQQAEGQGSRTVFELMKRNADRLFQLINQLLDLSKLEAGNMQLKLVHTDIVPFLKVLAGNFSSWADSKNIRFHLRFPSESVVMPYDRDKLEKTVNNLLSNAFKFTPEEGDVWFSVEREENELVIQIQDNGIGMSADQLMRIFDRFYQVEGYLYEGSGIGLALVKELVELHQGEIKVSSEPGQGSMFVVHLPILPSELPVEAILPAVSANASLSRIAAPASVSAVPKGEKPLLLLVEDNADVRSYLQSILQADYRLIMAENGRLGMEKAFAQIPDLIISDVMMPEMDGNELAQTLKTDQRTSHIPLILLTAKAGIESKLEGLETGADDYLPKPFDERELKIRVKNLIEQRERLRAQLGKDIVRLSPADILVESADKKFLDRVIGVIETYMQDETFSIEDLGREVGLSRSQLHRKLKALTDQSPSVFLRIIRLKRAKKLLEEGVGTAAEISYQVGFGSPAYFSKCFKDQFGLTPGEVKGG